jgi:hypothetical protein
MKPRAASYRVAPLVGERKALMAAGAGADSVEDATTMSEVRYGSLVRSGPLPGHGTGKQPERRDCNDCAQTISGPAVYGMVRGTSSACATRVILR